MHNCFHQRSNWQGPSQCWFRNCLCGLYPPIAAPFKHEAPSGLCTACPSSQSIACKFCLNICISVQRALSPGNRLGAFCHITILSQYLLIASSCTCLPISSVKCKSLRQGFTFASYVSKASQQVWDKYIPNPLLMDMSNHVHILINEKNEDLYLIQLIAFFIYTQTQSHVTTKLSQYISSETIPRNKSLIY